MIYYTIYKTINNINKKYYIGKHQTENLNDFYFGSGIAIENAIKKGIYEKNSGKFLIIYFNGNKEEIFNLRIYSENNNIPYATLRASAFNGKNIPKYNISKIKRLGKK